METVEPIKQMQYDLLPVSVYSSNEEAGLAAALDARTIIGRAIAEKGEANVILATGNSQLAFLRSLRELDGIDWSAVRAFHMDEYLDLAPGHPASFPAFLHQHFVDHVELREFYPIAGDAKDAQRICNEYTALLKQYTADLVALGWGENGHLAFNDPPYALFDDPQWVKVVELAEISRQQQVGEGHFASLEETPTHAITLTIPALLAAKSILCIVPEQRKATAVHACLTEPISEVRPGSILRRVDHAYLYLDLNSASYLTDKTYKTK